MLTDVLSTSRRLSRYSRSSSVTPRQTQLGTADEVPSNIDDNDDEMFHRASNADFIYLDKHISKQKPKDFLGQTKYYYDKYNLRHIAPFILLAIYSLLGAVLFRWMEREHELELIKKEEIILDGLRNDTFQQLKRVFRSNKLDPHTNLAELRKIFLWYEKQLTELKMPEGLEWDMWGSLFYVGTIFTTIGYGNIVPRTQGGQVLTIAYAIFGIPLVLAILSQFGRTLTRLVSSAWMRYQYCIKGYTKSQRFEAEKQRQNLWDKRRKHSPNILDVEEGGTKVIDKPSEDAEAVDDEEVESRTIPIWLALFICIAWICICAGLFCIWETRWSYFVSLYFFFISLTTIGLGDVVPDHPHMLILMFWLVIIGLSIVSMLLGVIQIKFEEWLYHLMIRMKKEYQRALASGDVVEREEILRRLMEKEPWYLRNLAPHILSEKQTDELDRQAETYERLVRVKNNKNVQTEDSFFDKSPSLSEAGKLQDMGTNMSFVEEIQQEQEEESIQRKKKIDVAETANVSVTAPTFASNASTSASYANSDADSVSGATSLPMDPTNSEVIDHSIQARVSLADQSQQVERFAVNGCGVQTDIAQFQVDEIMLKLHDLQTRARPELTDRGIETSLHEQITGFAVVQQKIADNESSEQLTKYTQYDITPSRVDISTETEPSIHELVERSVATEEKINSMLHRSMETDAWMLQLQMPECSRAVQTVFDDDDDEDQQVLLSTKRKLMLRKSDSIDSYLINNSTQCSFYTEDMCDTYVQTMLEMNDFSNGDLVRKEDNLSTMSLHGSLYDVDESQSTAVTGPERKDLIIQTDDSYLKIARRLDQIRTTRTESLNVCMAKPLKKSQCPEPAGSKLLSDNPSERRGFFLDSLHNRGKVSSRSNEEQKRTHLRSPGERTTTASRNAAQTARSKPSDFITVNPDSTKC